MNLEKELLNNILIEENKYKILYASLIFQKKILKQKYCDKYKKPYKFGMEFINMEFEVRQETEKLMSDYNEKNISLITTLYFQNKEERIREENKIEIIKLEEKRLEEERIENMDEETKKIYLYNLGRASSLEMSNLMKRCKDANAKRNRF